MIDGDVIATLAVSDIEKGKAFYGEKLGLEQTMENMGGVGYQVVDRPDFKASVEAGLTYVYEKFDAPDKAQQALHDAFDPDPEDSRILFHLPVTQAWLHQLTLGLILICHSSVRGATELLRDLFDYPLAVGTVHDILGRELRDVAGAGGDERPPARRHPKLADAGPPEAAHHPPTAGPREP